MAELDTARYILLTTFKRDGTAVASPVWLTGSAGTYSFTTGDRAWKTRRLRHDPTVHVQACGMRGRIKPGATLYRGTGEVLTTTEEVQATETALAAKYGWQFRGIKAADRLIAIFGRRDPERVVAIRLHLAEAPSEAPSA
jgi:PPOX class probable F420-dependent enzyme